MLMNEERKLLVEYGNRLFESKLTKGTGGNLSIYDRKTGYMAITPSGIEFHKTHDEDIVILTLDGKVIEGDKKPSSEWQMHANVYKNREDINSVIHAHTLFASIFACLRESILPSHYMLEVAGGEVRCAEYATFGSKELAENAIKSMEGRKAVLLANHGILAGEKDIANAFNVIDQVEYCANVYYRARSIGKPYIIDDEELKVLEKKFENYGQIK
ncbi:MAG: L-fuculose-phosphate aldolase [Peptoniphilaceae bacterium]|nr:L-fuculose-phosphate aldolase [Peptoniphilaceae bacterium]MDY6018084.1 L-fuculose-phosphate aldolase [Anaerococcus sp.]